MTSRNAMRLLAVLALAAPLAALADEFHLNCWSVDGGGGRSAGGDFEILATIGQPDAGAMAGGEYGMVGGFWGVPSGAVATPEIVHGAVGVSFTDHAFSGYIDSRCDVGTPPFCNMLNQVDSLNIVFNVEPFGDALGGAVTLANFVVSETGGGSPPNVINVTKTGTSVLVELDRVVTFGQWTTVEADVFNALGVPIEDLGNQGPGIDEPDRIDVAFLSADIDQSGQTYPLDNTRFRQMYAGFFQNPRGVSEDYVDINRDGSTLPLDVTVWRMNYVGWLFATLPSQP